MRTGNTGIRSGAPLLALSLAALLAAAPAARADKVLLTDGRQIEGRILPDTDGTTVRLQIGSFVIPIRSELVSRTFIEDLEGYVPRNKQEEENLKKGWVMFEGGWMSRTRREQVLAKRAAEDKAAIDELVKLQDWRNAVTEETRNFIVKSNCTEEVRKDYAQRLEAFYKYFTDFWNIKLSPGDRKGRLEFTLYRNYTDFLRVTGVPYGVGGFFSPVTGELQLYHDVDDPEETLGTLYHEGNHLLTHQIDPRFAYPTWLNEGMAEYFGSLHVDEQGQFHVGALQYGRIASLRADQAAGRFRKLRHVLMAEQSAYGYREYAYGWSFVHFMMESPKYGKSFRTFFATLPRNSDLKTENRSYSNLKGTRRVATEAEFIRVLEARFGQTVEQLEEEWLEYTAQAYGELTPTAYYTAAQLFLRERQDDNSNVVEAFEFFRKATEGGIGIASCYRDYAELLRKGGVLEAGLRSIVRTPDPAAAWDMIRRAIELDPIDPYNYCEAAGILLMDGPLQDLEQALQHARLAETIAGSRNFGVKALVSELVSKIEPAREQKRAREQREAELALLDRRIWHVAFHYIEGTEPPPNLADLTTEDLRALIQAGKVGPDDSVYQSFHELDEQGERIVGDEAWDKGWVRVADCPVFADALAPATESK